jgi:acyl-CoA thioesterase
MTSSIATNSVGSVDQALLGLTFEDSDLSTLSFVVTPHLCRIDSHLYGGAAIASALAAFERATGWPALWSTTQLVSAADLGETIRLDTTVVARGKSMAQVQTTATATARERLVFTSIGSCGLPRPDGLSGVWPSMPAVTPPEASEPMSNRLPPGMELTAGSHLASDHRIATRLDEMAGRHEGVVAWARFRGAFSQFRPGGTAASIAYLADIVPFAISRAAQVAGAGTSLDNSLRVVEPVACDWIMIEASAEAASGGYGHGHLRVWSQSGRLLAVGSQTARMFTYDDFVRRLATSG